MIKDTIAACRSYAAENASAEGGAVTFTLDKDVNTFCAYTTNTWDDGAPVAKMFERNESIPLFLPKGTVLHGVCYRGRASGNEICEFVYGGTWYRTYMVDVIGDNWNVFGCKSTAI